MIKEVYIGITGNRIKYLHPFNLDWILTHKEQRRVESFYIINSDNKLGGL